MWDGKYKAVTFSYDDGVEQDERLVRMFRRYGVKATFNLNSGIMTRANFWERNGVTIHRMNAARLPEIYEGFEIAVHTLTHPDLTKLDEETVCNEICLDRDNLERLFGRKIVGFAYPYGTWNENIVRILKEEGFRYARGVDATGGDCPLDQDMMILHPSAHHNFEGLMELARDFASATPDPARPRLLYIWGHSYEFDTDRNWERMEELLRILSNREDIYYGTNAEVLLGE